MRSPCATMLAVCLVLLGSTAAEALEYSAAVLADNPLGYWRFEETAGPAVDSSGNARDGEYQLGVVPGVDPGAGVIGGYAAAFDGRSGYVHLPGSWGGDTMVEATLEAWVNTSAPITGDFQVILAGHDPNSFAHFQLHDNPAGQTGFYVDNGWSPAAQIPPASPTGVWRHLVFTTKPGETRLYVDGEQLGATTIETTPHNYVTESSNVDIGRGHAGTRWFKGLIDEVAIYGTALSPDRVKAHYNTGIGITATLTWDEQGSDTWDSPSWLGGPPTFPDETAITVVNGTNTDTITVPANRPAPYRAHSLTMDGGRLVIEGGQTLAVTQKATFAAGVPVELGNGAKLSAGGGSLDTVTVAGSGTIDVTAEVMPVNSLAINGAGTFTKQGAGELRVDNSSGAAVTAGPTTVFRVEGGTLRARGVHPLDQAAQLELAGGTFSFNGSSGVPGAAPADAIAHWSFDTDATDSTGNHNGTMTGTATITADAKLGTGALDLRNGGYVVVPTTPLSGEAAYSISMFVSIESLTHGFGAALFANDGWQTSSLHVNVPTATRLPEGAINGNASWSRPTSTVPVDDSWVHLAFTYDSASGTGKAYFNGVEESSSFIGNTPVGNGPAAIGAWNMWGPYDRLLDGRIDDLNVYNRVLTAAEIATMAGTATPPNMEGVNVVVTADSALNSETTTPVVFGPLTMRQGILTTSGTAAISFAGTTVPAGTTGVIGFDPQVKTDYGTIEINSAAVTIAKGGPSTWTLNTTPGHVENAEWEVRGGTLKVADAATLAGRPVTLAGGTLDLGVPVAPGGAVAKYTFDEGSGTTAANSANPGLNDGELNGPTWAVDPERGQVLSFNGAGDYVHLQGSFGGPSWPEATLAGWVNTSDPITGDFQVIIGGHDPNAFAHFQLHTGGSTGFYVDTGYADTSIPPPTPTGMWRHIVMTTKSGETRVYVNGQPFGTPGTVTYNFIAESSNVDIGRGHVGTRWFKGLMDDVVMYDRALSAAEVADLYAAAPGGGGPLDMSMTDLTVTGDTTLKLSSTEPVAFKSLSLQAGTLTTMGTAPSVGFPGTGIGTPGGPATTVGIDPQMETLLGAINGNSVTATIAKVGAGDLVLDQPGVNLENATFDVRSGRLIGVHGSNPFGAAALQMSGGELVLSAKAGTTSPVVYDNATTVTNNSTVTARAAGGGTAGPMTVELGSASHGVDVPADKTLALRSADDYTLRLAGPLTGAGGISVAEGQVALGGGVDINSVSVSGGRLSTDGPATVAKMKLTGGIVDTHGNQVAVTESLKLGSVLVATDPGNPFHVSGADLFTASDITVSGGTIRVGTPVAPRGAVAYYPFDETSGDTAANFANPGLFDGKVTGATWTNDPVRGNVLGFAGQNYVQIADPVLDHETEYSISMFVSVDSIQGWGTALFANDGWTTSNLHVNIYSGTRQAEGAINGNSWPWSTTTSAVPLDGSWVHVAFTYDSVSGTAKAYFNGVEESSMFYGHTPVGNGPATIGAWGGTDRFLYGRLDDVFIYDRVLSSTEIKSLFEYESRNAGPLDAQNASFIVTDDTVLQIDPYQDTLLGNLTVAGGKVLTIDGVLASVNDLTAGDGATINGSLYVRGTLAPGGSLGRLTIGGGLELDDNATYQAEVGRAVQAGDPESDLVTITSGDANLSGTLSLWAAGTVKDPQSLAEMPPVNSWGSETRTILAISPDSEGMIRFDFTTKPQAGAGLGHGVVFEGLSYEWLNPNDPADGATAAKVSVYQAAPGDTVTTPANPGDPAVKVPDKNTNADDIQQILAEAKFNSGTAADWSQGDFNDDGVCNADDIQLILASALFNAGPYGAAAPKAAADAKAALRVTPAGLLIDTQGTTINGYVLHSAAGVLTGDAADNLGLMQEDSDSQISGQMFFSLSGTHLLGNVVGSEWSGVNLAQDLWMTYTVEGRAGIYSASVVVPEPGTILMLSCGLLMAVLFAWRRRSD